MQNVRKINAYASEGLTVLFVLNYSNTVNEGNRNTEGDSFESLFKRYQSLKINTGMTDLSYTKDL